MFCVFYHNEHNMNKIAQQNSNVVRFYNVLRVLETFLTLFLLLVPTYHHSQFLYLDHLEELIGRSFDGASLVADDKHRHRQIIVGRLSRHSAIFVISLLALLDKQTIVNPNYEYFKPHPRILVCLAIYFK